MTGSEKIRALTILLNRRAGRRGADAERRLSALFEPVVAKLSVQAIDPSRFASVIQQLLSEGHTAIGVSGGDGSMASAAAHLVGTQSAMLALPTGTLNNFAKRIGIRRPEEAVAALAHGQLRRVPVGIIDDQIFLNTATIGLYADVVRFRERLRPLLTKWPAAVVAAVFVLLRLRRLDLVVHVGGEYLRRSTPLLWIGLESGSFPRLSAASDDRLSPHLQIVLLKPGTRVNALSLFFRLTYHLLYHATPLTHPSLEVLHARNLLIHGSHRVGVTLDGEVRRLDPPVYIAIQDDALQVLVPAES